MYSDIFLEPHFDDVALSCGETVVAPAARGRRPLGVTVCANGDRAVERYWVA